jgi:hypothetical protein
MSTFRVRLHETRITDDDKDDVAIFEIFCEEDGRRWQVPVFLSPLFRVLRMEPVPQADSRRDMVAGLGAREITERLKLGLEPPFAGSVVFAADYPGSPGDPNPLLPYDQVIVQDGTVRTA